jgi:hypothetical protein
VARAIDHGEAKLARIVLSHKTHREGPGSYLHIREDLPLDEQITKFAKFWNISSSDVDELKAEVSEALLKAVKRPLFSDVPTEERLSMETVKKLLDDKQIQSMCEPVRLHWVKPDFQERLREEVLRYMEKQKAAEVSSKAHPIHWVLSYGRTASYSLISASGDSTDTSDLLTFDTRKKRFVQAEEYPAIDQLMKLFPDTTNYRINILHENDAGSQEAARFESSGFSPHRAYILHEVRDTTTGEMKTALRMKFHLPIVTNPHVDMHQHDRSYTFPEGEIFFFTNGCPHSVENRGNGPRIHLIWDMLLTEDTWDRSFGEGPDIGPEVVRARGAERQVPVKGNWHWTNFEQEPEKTWDSMNTYFTNLIDVTPPPACRRYYNTTDESATCADGPIYYVSRWDAKAVEMIM